MVGVCHLTRYFLNTRSNLVLQPGLALSSSVFLASFLFYFPDSSLHVIVFSLSSSLLSRLSQLLKFEVIIIMASEAASQITIGALRFVFIGLYGSI